MAVRWISLEVMFLMKKSGYVLSQWSIDADPEFHRTYWDRL